VPIRLIALDATNKVIGPEFLREFEARSALAAGRVVAGVLDADRESHRCRHLLRLGSAGCRRVAAPWHREDRPMHIEILQDAPEDGRTMASPGKPNARVAVDADAAAFARCS
jgi:hypothetical protein